MGANRLTGAPWHIEKLRPNPCDIERTRCKCIHLDGSNYCSQIYDYCQGPSHCPFYFAPGTRSSSSSQNSSSNKKNKNATGSPVQTKKHSVSKSNNTGKSPQKRMGSSSRSKYKNA